MSPLICNECFDKRPLLGDLQFAVAFADANDLAKLAADWLPLEGGARPPRRKKPAAGRKIAAPLHKSAQRRSPIFDEIRHEPNLAADHIKKASFFEVPDERSRALPIRAGPSVRQSRSGPSARQRVLTYVGERCTQSAPLTTHSPSRLFLAKRSLRRSDFMLNSVKVDLHGKALAETVRGLKMAERRNDQHWLLLYTYQQKRQWSIPSCPLLSRDWNPRCRRRGALSQHAGG